MIFNNEKEIKKYIDSVIKSQKLLSVMDKAFNKVNITKVVKSSNE